MHDLKRICFDCIEELAALGIRCGRVSRVEEDKRSVRTWGTCRSLPDGSFRIGISPRLLADEVPLSSLKETLYHELLHTVAVGDGHGKRWKMLANEVNRKLGTQISRVVTWEQQGLDQKKDAAVRYRFECTLCGAQVVRYRKCSFVRNCDRYRCSRCGGRFRPCRTP